MSQSGSTVFITGGTAEYLPPGTVTVYAQSPWPFSGSDGFSTGQFSTLTTAQLQAALNTAEQAKIAFMTGARAVEISYAQGDGSKSVNYGSVSLANINMLIGMLQQQLGIIVRSRRPGRMIFR